MNYFLQCKDFEMKENGHTEERVTFDCFKQFFDAQNDVETLDLVLRVAVDLPCVLRFIQHLRKKQICVRIQAKRDSCNLHSEPDNCKTFRSYLNYWMILATLFKLAQLYI